MIENVKKLKFQGDWAELRPKIRFLRQSGQGIWSWVGRSSGGGGQVSGGLISTFACFWTAITEV